MNNFKDELLDTQDLGLAIALTSTGYELVELEKAPYGKRVTFRFLASNDAIHRSAQNYWSGKLMVDAKTFWNESKNIKTRLYSL